MDKYIIVFRLGKSWMKYYVIHSTFITNKNKMFLQVLIFLSKKRTKVERSVVKSHFIGAIYLGSLMYIVFMGHNLISLLERHYVHTIVHTDYRAQP